MKITLFFSTIDNMVVFKEGHFTLEYPYSGSWICSKYRTTICTFDGIYGVTTCYPSGHIW